MTDSSVFSIRLTSEERQLADRYAKLHAMTTAEAFKKALFEKIEDEYDITLAEGAQKEYETDPTTYSHNEVKQLIGL